MPYPYDAPRPRSRLGAAVHSFFHPNEAYRLGQRTLSAEREADYYARSARNSEERAMSAEYERNSAEYDAEYNAHLADREHQRRSQAQRSTHDYGRRNLQRGYRVGYRDGSVDMHHAASGQRRVGYAYGLVDGYGTRVAQEQASLGYGHGYHVPRGRREQRRPQQQAPTSHPRQWGPGYGSGAQHPRNGGTHRPYTEGTRGRQLRIEDVPYRGTGGNNSGAGGNRPRRHY